MTDAAPVRADDTQARDFFDRVRQRLSLDVPVALRDVTAPAVRGDLDLDPETWKKAGVTAAKPAAVLIPVVDRSTPTVILTQRTTDLPSHPGQIAFPGGKIDALDETPVGAALREAEEEIGLAPALVEQLRDLQFYINLRGFRILPTVARIAPDFALALNRSEVAEVFEVPLEFLMTPENHRRRSRDWNGIVRHYYEIPYRNRYIWGV